MDPVVTTRFPTEPGVDGVADPGVAAVAVSSGAFERDPALVSLGDASPRLENGHPHAAQARGQPRVLAPQSGHCPGGAASSNSTATGPRAAPNANHAARDRPRRLATQLDRGAKTIAESTIARVGIVKTGPSPGVGIPSARLWYAAPTGPVWRLPGVEAVHPVNGARRMIPNRY